MLLATHSLHFRVHTRVLLTLLVALAAATLIWAGADERETPPQWPEAGKMEWATSLPITAAAPSIIVPLTLLR